MFERWDDWFVLNETFVCQIKQLVLKRKVNSKFCFTDATVAGEELCEAAEVVGVEDGRQRNLERDEPDLLRAQVFGQNVHQRKRHWKHCRRNFQSAAKGENRRLY